MGKVKDGSPVASSSKTNKPAAPSNAKPSGVAGFFANLFSPAIYKPLQGRWARLYTGLGLGLVVVLGLYQLAESLSGRTATMAITVGSLLAFFGWTIFRILNYPPFVEFLIATEAEMNKVSWTSREDLKRSTIVVLCTVLFMTVFLFGVDWLWSNLLKLIHVIQIPDTSSLGTGG
ncbi:MAG: preprotein translocase subunit SecE [Isosphaeraceae bacterium]|nr:preprotein translocase subunit SecE [Isosphaeraceae bacterium]